MMMGSFPESLLNLSCVFLLRGPREIVRQRLRDTTFFIGLKSVASA
jgi:hypothetical protein